MNRCATYIYILESITIYIPYGCLGAFTGKHFWHIMFIVEIDIIVFRMFIKIRMHLFKQSGIRGTGFESVSAMLYNLLSSGCSYLVVDPLGQVMTIESTCVNFPKPKICL